MVVGDLTRLAQIITNLLGNAIKYTAPGGAIRIDLERQGQDAVLTICDSGVGIASDLLPRVFDLFMQADRSDERGLGIGLALAKRLVELHGGAIDAHSAGVGEGSAFVVRLPLDGSSPGVASETPAISAGAETSVRILVIDDSRDVADSLAMVLRSFDYTVEVAYDGRSGVEAARTFRPDVAFVDLHMPGIDGYETARWIRALAGVPRPTLVALSGAGPEKNDGLSVPDFDLQMLKPVRPDAITELISRRALHGGDGAGSDDTKREAAT